MKHAFRTTTLYTAFCSALALATLAAPALAFAQNNGNVNGNGNAAPAAAPVATGYGINAPAPVDRMAKQRASEQTLLGAPREYSSDDLKQGDTEDAQRTALLNEQRMKVLGNAQGAQGGQPNLGKGVGKGNVKANAAANGAAQFRVADQANAPVNAADALMPAGAAKNTYADPYATRKGTVYRSPW
ncbi:hypothetical protein LFL96_03435 [Paraburkholderia sp. D15]|uniref:hypothetical protein n=1 Tax=Paraburkholderia sp. D15 TaxID=2880218 RepID=UPI002479EA40|nr:hypothetical protein [Paraburkholderia sp. D15]WGS50574.1 hypothetical protein LFL96_03435 [Paraburkholderia sp. D15]